MTPETFLEQDTIKPLTPGSWIQPPGQPCSFPLLTRPRQESKISRPTEHKSLSQDKGCKDTKLSSRGHRGSETLVHLQTHPPLSAVTSPLPIHSVPLQVLTSCPTTQGNSPTAPGLCLPFCEVGITVPCIPTTAHPRSALPSGEQLLGGNCH